MKIKILLFATLILLVLSGSALAETHLITLNGFAFTPDNITVRSGDIVRWEVVSGSHTTTNGTGALDPQAGVLWDEVLSGGGASYERTFTVSGVYPFFCRPHEGSGMKGTIIVAASVPSGSVIANAGLIGFIVLVGGLSLMRQHDLFPRRRKDKRQ